MLSKNILRAGKNVYEAKSALIILHGRGGNARDILSLTNNLNTSEFALFAPQASNHSWYPYSFLAPTDQNEPWLSAALELLHDLLEEIQNYGFPIENVFFAGFSQGACLAAEFVTRNAVKFGGIALFTGGLIGDTISTENYRGDFKGTPIFIGTGNPDSHVPVERVKETQKIMESMNAQVSLEIYENRPHTVSKEEIDKANLHVFKNKKENIV